MDESLAKIKKITENLLRMYTVNAALRLLSNKINRAGGPWNYISK